MAQITNRFPAQLRLFAEHRVLALARRSAAAWILVVVGDMSLLAWEPLVLDAVRDRYVSNPRTADKAAREAARLMRYLRACGAVEWSDVSTEMVTRWCWAPSLNRSGVHQDVAPATARNRQWAAWAALEAGRVLGAPIDPAALIGVRIGRSTSDSVVTRPLSVDEAVLVRDVAEAALSGSRTALIVAFAFGGGSASEIAATRLGDIDLEATTVAFSGERSRVNSLDDWAVLMMQRFLASQRRYPLKADDLLCVTTKADLAGRAHSVTVRLGEVLRDAGLGSVPGVSARSIRLSAARTVLDCDGIEAAARFLGSVSLDTTAAALNYDWECDG